MLFKNISIFPIDIARVALEASSTESRLVLTDKGRKKDLKFINRLTFASSSLTFDSVAVKQQFGDFFSSLFN